MVLILEYREPKKINNEAVTAVTVEENEDPSSHSPCSGALEPIPLPGDNLGFDTTAEEGLVNTLHISQPTPMLGKFRNSSENLRKSSENWLKTS